MHDRENTAPDRVATVQPAPAVVQALDELASLVRSQPVVSRIWNHVLTQPERDKIAGNGRNDSDLVRDFAGLKGVSQQRAVIELAHEVDLVSGPAYRRLLRQLNEELPPPVDNTVPRWDDATGQLWFGGKVVKTVKQRKNATCVVKILAAFQEEGWHARIDDPLPGVSNAPQRMHDTIKSLNHGLEAIRFHGDGSGEGIAWAVV